ncbi:MAG: 2-C-methyl-D-erythritol 4-phosphate cytidylyltransferase [Sulfuriflexus sp.]|nr:2-C-methyl-D-erythritol 4-phosphate cytidylyltransferase [Sulfuriflexus sp.]
MTVVEQKFWVIIPASGIGSRMNADRPKQYLPLNGKTVLEHTLDCFTRHPRISGVIVAISADDKYWPKLHFKTERPVITVEGGVERCHSVLNALTGLKELADDHDWVLVHDAARPCLNRSDLDKLLITMATHPVGGLLGVPVHDTIKKVDSVNVVESTVDREYLWRALTPQMFRYGMLRDALNSALADGYLVTDDASAIEHAGYAPLMLEGHAGNIKITRPEDLALAEFYLIEKNSNEQE